MSEYTVGVDVGGTKVAAALVDETGAIVQRALAETASSAYPLMMQGIVRTVNEVSSEHRPGAVGLAIAGNVDAQGAHVLFSPNLPLAGEPLATDLSRALGVPVVLDNDANAAAWAEHECGAGSGATELLFIAMGTGLGAGLVLNNHMYRGALGFAGEAGHMTVVVDGRQCPCGARGCWERYASGTALVAEYIDRGGDPEIGGAKIAELAKAGDGRAVAAFERVAEWLGRGLASLVAVLDPELVVIGGGVGEAGDVLLVPARAELARSITGAGRRPLPPVVAAALGNEAGVVGAAMLARPHLA